MKTDFGNPFNLTKANDFSDTEIQEFWVDIPGEGGLLGLLKPTSPMPMLVLGGKGSGKTHLMRFCSFELQKVRMKGGSVMDAVHRDGYMGIYLRCEGLNANRFSHKGQSIEVWNDVFQYYMELFLGELLLRNVVQLLESDSTIHALERDFVHAVMSLFDSIDGECPGTLPDLTAYLRRLRAEVDGEVNNCALRKTLNVTIRASRSTLIFGIPAIVTRFFSKLSNTLFVYLIDELENFSLEQQKYVFTLLRERRAPCSFKVGARLYGIKTYQTFSGDEEIKEGAEYEKLPLDELLREEPERYKQFATSLVAARVSALVLRRPDLVDKVAGELEGMFALYPVDKYAREQTKHVLTKYDGRERPYFEQFAKEFLKYSKGNGEELAALIEHLRVPTIPLLEKVNLLILFQAWAANLDMRVKAVEVKMMCSEFKDGRGSEGDYARVFSHFSSDMLAQLLRQTGRDQEYVGVDSLIHMSMGLPRNLLICLKHIYHWSLFNAERPFETGVVSLDSQKQGVRQAAEWFFRDASTKGEEGRFLQEAITRLAELFREIRFSEKPAECSLCTFSTDTSKLSEVANRYLSLAEKYSLLIGVRDGQKDRNSMRVDAKYQLNSMLAPRWDLPIFRRGTIPLSSDLVNAIFDPSKVERFPELLRLRVAGMSPPFRAKQKGTKGDSIQGDSESNLQLGFENV